LRQNLINKINPAEISAFTVDDENTKDYDDAISIKFHDDYVLISVHITNFSNLIDYMSEPEIFAQNKMQTIYSPYGNYNLYSDEIIEQISLIKNFLLKTKFISLSIFGTIGYCLYIGIHLFFLVLAPKRLETFILNK